MNSGQNWIGIAPATMFAQNAEFLGADFVNKGGNKVRISVSASTASILQVTRDGGTTWSGMKENEALVANGEYIFEFGSDPGDQINFRSTTSGGITLNHFTAELFYEG